MFWQRLPRVAGVPYRSLVTSLDLIGWTAVALGITLGLPQLVRLWRTRNVDGLSLLAWRTMLAVNIAWTVHGVRIEQVPIIVVNVFGLVTTVPILLLLARELRRRLLPTLMVPIAVATVMIVVDLTLGSAAYGAIATVLGIAVNLGQSVELVRASHVEGVSAATMVMNTVCQGLWLVFAWTIHDPGAMMTSSAVGLLTAFNITWYVLRRRGLRAFFAHDTRGAALVGA